MSSLYIGFDDTDSRHGMCTTYLAYKVVDFLLKRNARFLDYPLLIRLNPNIPWKTRGNGAVALRVEVDNEKSAIEGVKSLVENNSHIGHGANPGLVFYSGKNIPDDIKEFANRALHDVLSRKSGMEIAKKHDVDVYALGNGQGIVGALSAIGTLLNEDHTFEIIAYRKQENCGKLREISKETVVEMAKQTHPNTYNNYDYKHERVLITPHGPDPIFCGIRGEDPDTLVQAFLMLEIHEELEGHMIFRTNHGTNAHLMHKFDLSQLKTYTSGYVEGIVDSTPYAIKGGHAFFTIKNDEGLALCAVYEPTGLSQFAQKLSKGDLVEIGGGVRKATSKHPKVINVEYISISRLARKLEYVNPLCKNCDKRLKSDGKDKGYKCEVCGLKERNAQKVFVEVARDIKEGLYVPTPKAHRHLTKPLQRYGMEKKRYGQVLNSHWYCKFASDNLGCIDRVKLVNS
jgi:tRNA(Ile2)-agmatinylcytidine synthase